MTTLTESPLAPLLERLFTEADATARAIDWDALDGPDGSISRLMSSRTEYLELYSRMKDFPLPVSRETGRMLYMLARSCRATSIVEFGTSFGISTLHLAAALRDNGGGLLITSEFEPSKIARAQANLVAGGLDDLVEIRAGDALQTLGTDLPGKIDLVLLDGAKPLYPDILRLLEPRLRPGALIVADNADSSPEYLARVRSPEHGYLSVPFGGDVELSQRLGA
ncbi:methyltransferase [Pandoraea iniqua]|uniref:O-methyltransferase n=1 Tax=Pandoraea iniqua TaxID=2508288 RepID=UPI001240F717|nr:class I SAM-dependent methyltransferase [Pandoraea iniqua]VVE10735.1 methyltransferase [Pandoraea iniqua]